MPINLVDPTVSPVPYLYKVATRVRPGPTPVLGLVSNGKPNAESVLTGVASRIGELFGVSMTHELVTKPHASRVMPSEQVDLIVERCNFAIVGVGD
ncbi:MAG: hypothetical protein HOH43_01705 [Candidatus Latescibacteria bacterium]|jgi:hypothetical protein|nr:hypothetical protein [Candidatus Latescibacterota bacterium]